MLSRPTRVGQTASGDRLRPVWRRGNQYQSGFSLQRLAPGRPTCNRLTAANKSDNLPSRNWDSQSSNWPELVLEAASGLRLADPERGDLGLSKPGFGTLQRVRTAIGMLCLSRWSLWAATTSCCRATPWSWSWDWTARLRGRCTTPRAVWRGPSATCFSTGGGPTWGTQTCRSCLSWRDGRADEGHAEKFLFLSDSFWFFWIKFTSGAAFWIHRSEL